MNRLKAMDLIGAAVLMVLAGVLLWKSTHFPQWNTFWYIGAAGCALYAVFCLGRGLARRAESN
jgi:hypothetical protein